MSFEWIDDYLKENAPEGKIALMVCRGDGVVIGRYIEKRMKIEEQESAALLCGAWNALKVLPSMGGNPDDLRLSFDHASGGHYIVSVEGFDLFLSCFYDSFDNPGKLKNYLKLIREELSDLLAQNKYSTKKVTGGKLFSDITDHEIDQLFAF